MVFKCRCEKCNKDPLWLRWSRVQAPGRERSVSWSCARRSTPQQSVRRNAGGPPGSSGSTRAYERSRQRHAHQVTSTRCSACGGWSCERRRLHAAAERATLLEHQRRKTPRTSCDEVSLAKTGSLLTRQEGTRVGLCAQSSARRANSQKEEQRRGHLPPGDQPQNWRATVPSNGGHQSQDWAGKPLRFNLGGVFESCDDRVRHVGGQFTVLDGNVSEVSSMSSTMRCWSPAVRRVVLGNTLAEVSSWTALSWCLRSWYVAVMCISSASPSSLPFSVLVRLRCSLPCSTGCVATTASLVTASLSVSASRPAAFAQRRALACVQEES